MKQKKKHLVMDLNHLPTCQREAKVKEIKKKPRSTACVISAAVARGPPLRSPRI